MKTLLWLGTAVFLISLLGTPTLGAGWFWDLGNALGFAALAGLLYLSLASARALPYEPHRFLGHAVLALVALHAFWLLLGDAAVVEYLRPGAPPYMWAGLTALVLLLLMMLLALPEYRQRLYRDRTRFRRWHRWLGVAIIAAALWHIAAAGHYLRSPLQWLALLALGAFASLGYLRGVANNDLDRRSARYYLPLMAVAAALFVLIRNIGR